MTDCLLVAETICAVQMRALTTYVQRIYFPFLLAEPVKRSGEASTCLLWPHTPFLGSEDTSKGAALGCMAIVPSLDSLPQALQDVKKAASSAREMPHHCLLQLSPMPTISSLAPCVSVCRTSNAFLPSHGTRGLPKG